MTEITAAIIPWFILILGLSYVAQAKNWISLSREATEMPHRYYPLVLLLLVLGLTIVTVHNIWVWDWPVVITVLGWIMVAKSLVFLLFVQLFKGIDGMPETGLMLWVRIGGGIMIILGSILVYRNVFAS